MNRHGYSAALLVLLSFAMQPAAAQELPRTRIADEGELRELLSDRTVHGVYADGNEWIEYHAADGRSAYWDGCTRPGRWWIEDGLACYRYAGDPANTDHCWYVFTSGPRIEFVYAPDGPRGRAGAYSRSIAPGNPENLPLDGSDCVSASAAPITAPGSA
jgi:hypothetical protein